MLKWLTFNALGTFLFTRRKGEFVAKDEFGNKYYRERRVAAGQTARRWVIYPDGVEPDPTLVPAGWYGWLHYRIDDAPSDKPLEVKRWEEEHEPNLTGSDAAYVPAGHVRRGGHRDKATGDYEAWRP